MKLIKQIQAYLELTKPRIVQLVLVTTTLGYYLGGDGFFPLRRLGFLLLGTAFTCAGASVLNHFWERDFDAQMLRTKNRPIPLGLISPASAFNFGAFLTIIGVAFLYIEVNILAAFLSLVTTFLYVLVYTPMKRTSWLNTSMGAIPGAIPPLGGWAAATGTLNFDAGILFLILFVWQHPHFYAIAWMFQEDYKRGGFQMLPCLEGGKQKTADQIWWYSLLLLPVSIIPTLTGMCGWVYFVGAFIAGLLLIAVSKTFLRLKTNLAAKQLLRATVFYLPVLLALIIVDAIF